eukprot:UN24736
MIVISGFMSPFIYAASIILVIISSMAWIDTGWPLKQYDRGLIQKFVKGRGRLITVWFVLFCCLWPYFTVTLVGYIFENKSTISFTVGMFATPVAISFAGKISLCLSDIKYRTIKFADEHRVIRSWHFKNVLSTIQLIIEWWQTQAIIFGTPDVGWGKIVN